MSKDKKTLKELRKDKGYTQLELAYKAGVAISTYTKWELDDISLEKAKAGNVLNLAKALGVSVEELL